MKNAVLLLAMIFPILSYANSEIVTCAAEYNGAKFKSSVYLESDRSGEKKVEAFCYYENREYYSIVDNITDVEIPKNWNKITPNENWNKITPHENWNKITPHEKSSIHCCEYNTPDQCAFLASPK